MKRYRAVLEAEFAIEAENIVQARLAAKRIRALGEVAGWRGAVHDQRGTQYSVALILERVAVRRASPGGDREGGGR